MVMAQRVVLILWLLVSKSSSFSPGFKGSYNSQCHHTINYSTIATGIREDEGLHSQNEAKHLKCQGCEVAFVSRNALFRHLRGEDDASLNCSIAMQARPSLAEELLMTVVVRYGYYRDTLHRQANDADNIPVVENRATNELVANMIQKAFIEHATCKYISWWPL